VICHIAISFEHEYQRRKDAFGHGAMAHFAQDDMEPLIMSSNGHYTAMILSKDGWTYYDSLRGGPDVLSLKRMAELGVKCPDTMKTAAEVARLNYMVLEWCSFTGAVMFYSREDPTQ
jgi:hypothetical protein